MRAGPTADAVGYRLSALRAWGEGEACPQIPARGLVASPKREMGTSIFWRRAR